MMTKKIISVLSLVLIMSMTLCLGVFAEPQDQIPTGDDLYFKSAEYDAEAGALNLTVASKASYEISEALVVLESTDGSVSFTQAQSNNFMVEEGVAQLLIEDMPAGGEKELVVKATLSKDEPALKATIRYAGDTTVINTGSDMSVFENVIENIFAEDSVGKLDAIVSFLKQTGFSMISLKQIAMILIACLLLYLAIVKQFEPLLLLPIAFGMLLTNLAGAEMFHEELFADGHVHWNLFAASNYVTPGLIDILYLGVKLGIYPCLIFVGVGAMTDFGPLIANPKSLLLGAAAQVGIFATYLGARALGFTPAEAGSIGIIGGADGPTAIFVTTKLAPHLLGPIAVAAYSYMALVPVIQPPIMKLLTTKKERQIEMKALREVSRTEKIVFPIVVTVFVALLVPSAGALVGCLMLGNLLKECGVCERLSKTVQNELMNIVTVFLGVSVGATATANTFLSLETIKIIVMGVVAFGVATACGVLLAKFMNLFLKNKINPLIGSAGVSAVPMAARVSQVVGQKDNPSNFLLMHAMGPNVAGVIGSAIAAGAIIAMIG